jgi:hypothetical protein
MNTTKITGAAAKTVRDRTTLDRWIARKQGAGTMMILLEEHNVPFGEYSRRSLSGYIAKHNRKLKSTMMMAARPGSGVADVLASTRRGGTVEAAAVGSTLGEYFFSNDVETASIANNFTLLLYSRGCCCCSSSFCLSHPGRCEVRVDRWICDS